jgi:Uma2 family endonuclease
LKKIPKRPHLAIELQWSRSAVNKLEIYRRLGVREVWLWKRPNVIAVHVFRRGAWREVPRSPRFPDLDLAWLCTFLDRSSMTQAMRGLRAILEA